MDQCPKRIIGGTIGNSLIEDALQYIGVGDYGMVDMKNCGQFWMTYFKPLPEESRVAHLKWFYEMTNALRALVKLNLSVEGLGTSMFLQMMEADYANEVRSSLKVNTGPGNADKAAFSH